MSEERNLTDMLRKDISPEDFGIPATYRKQVDLYVEFLAAAPQVVADERKELDGIADLFSIGAEARKEPGVILANVRNTVKFANLLHAVEREFFMSPDDENGCLVNCWGSTEEQYLAAMRVALQAAPVQAQEPVARKKTPNPFPEGSPNENWRRGYEGLRHFGAPDSQAAMHWKMGRAARKADDLAPVQPVAVPDGWKLVPVELTPTMLDVSDAGERTTKKVWRDMLAVAPTAPAAYGYAKDAERWKKLCRLGAAKKISKSVWEAIEGYGSNEEQGCYSTNLEWAIDNEIEVPK